MSLALKKEHLPHYTYEDYCQWEGNWELIEGVPYAMSPLPTSKHQRLSGELYVLLREQLQKCKTCEVSLPVDWKIDEATVVQPDLFVAYFDFKNVKYISKPPVVVVEILSPSTRDKDLFVKRPIYCSQGVKYYVIVDPDNDTYKVLQLAERDYKEAKTNHTGTFKFQLADDCAIEVDFAKIWE